MHSLKELIEKCLASTDNETELARALVDSGALERIVERGTYGDATVLHRLKYSSEAGLRAAVSKARKNKGSFPLPILEGRRWPKSTVDEYRKTQKRTTSNGSNPTKE